MSNRLFQGTIVQMKDVLDRTVGVLDENGVIISCSVLSMIGESRAGVIEELFRSDYVRMDGYTYRSIDQNKKNEYVVFVEGVDEEAARYCGIFSVSLGNIKQFYDERYDKSNFIKNIVMDNILPGDIYAKARELHFTDDVQRVVLLVRAGVVSKVSVYDVVSGLFPEKQKDFVFNISAVDTVIVKEVKTGVDMHDVEKLAGSICDTLETEYYMPTTIGIGTVVGNLAELASSFKEAQVALEVGKVFDTETSIISYDNLGIARLIYQLPTTLCEMFLREVFKKGSIDSLDQETLFTIQRFFENNLNVSETSRGLFVHRNTLVYRLEKIKKLTGLDLRQFDQAIVFKVALMVKKYLDSNPAKY